MSHVIKQPSRQVVYLFPHLEMSWKWTEEDARMDRNEGNYVGR